MVVFSDFVADGLLLLLFFFLCFCLFEFMFVVGFGWMISDASLDWPKNLVTVTVCHEESRDRKFPIPILIDTRYRYSRSTDKISVVGARISSCWRIFCSFRDRI